MVSTQAVRRDQSLGHQACQASQKIKACFLFYLFNTDVYETCHVG